MPLSPESFPDLTLVPLPLEQLPPLPPLRVAVLGHVEVVRFVEIGRAHV